MKGKTFKIDTGALNKLTSSVFKRLDKDDQALKRRFERATEMVWRIAHQKRPYISRAQMKAEGRSVRVSDPNAQLGVPVRTGNLQISVQKEVTRHKLFGYEGKIFVQGPGQPYAGYIEYGTSKMAARPFMRPAINLTRDAIKRMFGLKVDSKL